MATYLGSCHCQAVKFVVETGAPLHPYFRCNCSLCSRKGAVMGQAQRSALRVTQGEHHLSVYRWNTGEAQHFFCRRCGIYTHHVQRGGTDLVGINMACVEGFDVFAVSDVMVGGGAKLSLVSGGPAPAFIVRRARPEDGAALVDLRRRLFAETSNMLWEPDEFVQTAQDESARIARLNERPNSLVLLAEAAGAQAVGVLTAVGGEVRRLQHSTTLALGVAQSHWGQGIATALIDEALRWSRSVPLQRVELTVHTRNQRAVKLYLGCGFQVEGVRRSSLRVDGAYVDEYLMSVVHDVPSPAPSAAAPAR